MDATIAAAPPVAPHLAPSTSSSGTKTTVSTASATFRIHGRPIETGNDFVQPQMNCSAAATRTSRAAVVACSR